MIIHINHAYLKKIKKYSQLYNSNLNYAFINGNSGLRCLQDETDESQIINNFLMDFI